MAFCLDSHVCHAAEGRLPVALLQASEKKLGLDQAVAMQSQYESLLKEYAEYLETAQTKLQSDEISAKGLPHLKQQLAAHKAFFIDLDSHRSLLDALQQKVSPTTRQRFLPTHTELINSSHVVQDKAALRGQQLDRLCTQWADFQQQYADLNIWLDRLERQMPEPMHERDTLEEIRGKIWDFHAIQGSLNEEKANVYHILDKGKQLLQAVSCVGLDEELTAFSDQWAQLNNDVDNILKK